MIIAPLMLPIMGTAFGVANGDGKVIGISLLVGMGGILTAIAVGWVMGKLLITSAFDPTLNSQIITRTAPSLLDLVAALVTGLAGAFAIGRKDISDTLPGVAISISLVPPLANTGILLAAGRTALALGSILLFVTNYLAILPTGALVFGLMGYPRVSLANRSRVARLTTIAVAILMFILILFPLGLRSLVTYLTHSAVGTVTEATQEWLAGTEISISSVAYDQDLRAVHVVVAGSEDLPLEDGLRDKLQGRVFGFDVVVEAITTERLRIAAE